MTQNPEPRIRAFEKMAFGLFIHYGLYSAMGSGEWAMHIKSIERADYKRLMETFTARNFDADAYAQLAKSAGMRYMVLTARHHDGFSLYDTRGQGTHDSLHTPAGRDLVAEFVGACRRAGLVPFLYHCTLDWSWRDKTTWDLGPSDFNVYLDYLKESVETLCTSYGPLGGLWFDGNWSRPDMDWKLDELYGMVRSHQPDAIIINNTGLYKPGQVVHPEIDAVTWENQSGKTLDRASHRKYFAAEVCCTMNSHWGIAKDDYAYKSVADLIKTMARSRRAGANFLLNVGPEQDGRIPDLERATLERLGAWTNLYAEALYEAVPCSVVCAGDDFMLKKDGRYYWFVFNLDILGHADVTQSSATERKRTARGMVDSVWSVRWLDNDEALVYAQSGESLTVEFTGYRYGENRVVRVAELAVS